MSVPKILEDFSYSHLPEPLAAVSKPYHDLAHSIVNDITDSENRSMALWYLLISKDAAVRAKRHEIGGRPTPVRVP